MSVLSMTAALGFSTINSTGYSPTSDVGLLSGVFIRTQEILGQFREAAQHIRDSADLTETGKGGQMQRLGVEYVERLRKSDPVIEQATRNLDNLRKKITISSTEGDNVARTLREQEIRGLLLQMDAVEVQEVWMTAIEEGDQLTFDAIRNAPKFTKLILPDTQRLGEAEWLDKRNPANAKELRDLTSALQAATDAIARVRSTICREANLPESDPIARLAE